MGKVFLVYADDYGGSFSPYVLYGVYREEAVANAVAKSMLGTVTEHPDLGDHIDAYPKYRGGLFSDE